MRVQNAFSLRNKKNVFELPSIPPLICAVHMSWVEIRRSLAKQMLKLTSVISKWE